MTDNIERLQQLLNITDKEAFHLSGVSQRLYNRLPTTPEQLETALKNPEFIDTLESFTAKFARLQDTIADKLLPIFLINAGEKKGTVIENLNRAEALSLISDTQSWLATRSLRNKLVHEYIADYKELYEAITLAREFSNELIATQKAIKQYCNQILNIEQK